jgi:hypothetical protein
MGDMSGAPPQLKALVEVDGFSPHHLGVVLSEAKNGAKVSYRLPAGRPRQSVRY